VLAPQLGDQRRQKRPPLAGAQVRQARHEVRRQRAGAADALGEQQPLDAVAVGGALAHQPLAFARAPAGVLLLGRGRARHRAHPRLAAHPCRQHPHQMLEIEPIGLRPPRPPAHRYTRRVDDLVAHALRAQPAVQPPAVVPGLVEAPHPDRPKAAAQRPRPRLPDQIGHRRHLAARHRVAAQLARPRRHDPELPLRLAQFKHHQDRAILARGGGRIDAV
jgi:hypothetical protein